MQSLVLSRGVSSEGLAHLANLSEMERLGLQDTQIDDAGLTFLKQMNELRNLGLDDTRVTEEGLVHLVGFQNLELLSLPFDVGDAGLMHLLQLTSLKSVAIQGDSVTGAGLVALSNMKSLEYVNVNDTEKMDTLVGELVKMSGLRALKLGAGLIHNGPVQLKNLPLLMDLTLPHIQLTSRDMAALAQLHSLRMLDHYDVELSRDEDWEALGKLSSLQSLDLSRIRSEITDGRIANLTGLHSLKRLEMSTKRPSSITDAALKHISELKAMESLKININDAKITDEGLEYLEGLDSLKSLDLQGCTVTGRGLQRLKKKLPALRLYL